ncbi:NUDIX hydrolase [Aeromicrobium sp. PE09-221]|uniref:NUDIX hydrolase n=1 Tax=Aeromicrobium sp. PE09-221 TaxID=1898043 RepID=UPI001482572B|nr:NUDIX hydrolase [Aeromicrobium sp. PE09-221]
MFWTPYVEVEQVPVAFPDGRKGTYARINRGKHGGVCIPRHVFRGIARYALVRQYRYVIDRITLEFPGGFTTEAGCADAVREMTEETGINSHGRPTSLGVLHADTGLLASENDIWLVPVLDLKHVEAGTGAETVWLTDGELDERVIHGEITSGITLGALAKLRASSFAIAPGTMLSS